MQLAEYHEKIIQYYKDTENAYKDCWDLNNSLAIHYGYWDEKVKTFPQSLTRMNEVMMETAAIKTNDAVLDAGCGVGGSSIFIAATVGAKVTGITLSERQVVQAKQNAKIRGVEPLVDFKVMDYCATDFPGASFDVVWGCESVCYAGDKEQFIKEAFRLLKPGGRLVVADGFVARYENNDDPVIRQWLDGWQVNYLESPQRFTSFMEQTGFMNIQYRDISREASYSSRRLYKLYFVARLLAGWRKMRFGRPLTEMQKKNTRACKFQYKGLKKGLWEYGLITGTKTSLDNS
jgi:tocopherol O-methyltransferase